MVKSNICIFDAFTNPTIIKSTEGKPTNTAFMFYFWLELTNDKNAKSLQILYITQSFKDCPKTCILFEFLLSFGRQ